MVYNQVYREDVDRVSKCIPGIAKLNGTTVVVSGASGMLCSPLVDILLHLNAKYNSCIKLVLLGRDKHKIQRRFEDFQLDKDYSFIEFDSTNNGPIGVNGDYFIHGASNADPKAIMSSTSDTIMSNIVGLRCMLEAAKESKAKAFLYVSSGEIYGNNNGNTPFDEQSYGYIDLLNPRSCYPNAKRLAETLCACFNQDSGLKTVIVRPCHIYGPTISKVDSRASAQFSRQAAEGKDIIMKSAGSQMRSYCYILDCASAMLTVLVNGNGGEAYNISNPNSIVSIRAMAEAFAQSGGVNVVFENPTDIERKSFNLMSNSSLDSSKLLQLGWKPCFSLTDGAERTVRLLKKQQ